MRQVLIETQAFNAKPVSLTESVAPSGNPLVEGILATAEVKNGNGRYYSKDLWEREINNYRVLVDENRATGELDHPESSIINLKALIENNVQVGVSSRGMGSLEDKGGVLEVQDDFELLCWDFVSTPSNPGSYMHLTEGKEMQENKYLKVNTLLSEILCANGTCPVI